jgi:hypothetical protein
MQEKDESLPVDTDQVPIERSDTIIVRQISDTRELRRVNAPVGDHRYTDEAEILKPMTASVTRAAILAFSRAPPKTGDLVVYPRYDRSDKYHQKLRAMVSSEGTRCRYPDCSRSCEFAVEPYE